MSDDARAGAGNTDVDAEIAGFLLDPARRRHPAPFYRWLHEVAPVRRLPSGTVLVASHPVAHAALRDPRLGKGRGSPDDIVPRPGAAHRASLPDSVFTASLVHLNPPEHTRLRDMVSRSFSRRRVEALRPGIAALVDSLLADLAGRGGGDLVVDLGFAVPVWVMGEMLGVPEADRAQFRPLVRDQALLFEPGATDADIDRAMVAARAMVAYFATLLRERRHRPGDDLLSALLAERDADGRPLSRQELVGLAMLLLGAGFETTSALIGNTIGTLLSEPAELDHLRDDPTLVPATVEESLRFEAPVQLAARVALESAEVGDIAVPAGTWVICLLGAANRDPVVCPAPDRFDVGRYAPGGRGGPPVLSFSAGIHHCLGAPLARLEGAVVLERWLASGVRFEPLTDELAWRSDITSRGLEGLEVSVRGS